MLEKLNNLFEDTQYPSLGPLVTVLKKTCIWPERNRLQSALYWLTLSFSIFLGLNQLVFMLYLRKPDIVLNFLQFSVYHLGLIKMITFTKWHAVWVKLIKKISSYEIELQHEAKFSSTIKQYIWQSRVVIYFFWSTSVLMNVLFFSKAWFNLIRATESMRPKLFYFWTPFNNCSTLGSYFDMFMQNLYGDMTSVYVMTWDALAENVMLVMAGQLRLIRLRFQHCLDSDDENVQKENIIKCYKHYMSLIEMQQLCNSVMSPAMFLHLMIVAVNFGVMISNMSTYDRAETLTAITFILGLVMQLGLLYWFGNEVTVASILVSKGLYESAWCGRSFKIRRYVLVMLTYGTNKRLVFNAGPFTEMSMATTVAILRASYSFYTLMDQRK